jgi:hypothetical protein
MEKIKPLIFAGGTKEKSTILVALTTELQDVANVHPWWSGGAFKPMENTLEGLLAATRKYDFAIFILTPDDFIISRDMESFTARDNVLFEFGQFLGALGPKRTKAFAQDDPAKSLKVPSDLLGVKIPRFTYTDDDNLTTSMVVLRNYIEPIVQAEGPRSFELAIAWDILRAKQQFVVELGRSRRLLHADKIRDRELLLVCRKHDALRTPDDDERVMIGTPRVVDPDEREVVLSVDMSGRLDKPKRGDVIEGYLFLLPKKAQLPDCKTMRDLKNAGCLALDRGLWQPVI